MKHYQAIVIGGGSAGLSAAVTLKKNGIEDIVVLEKDCEPGGILEQCIQAGNSRMRNFQRALVEAHQRLYAYSIDKIVDVDHAEDIITAETFLQSKS